jgi:hypothetical protein
MRALINHIRLWALRGRLRHAQQRARDADAWVATHRELSQHFERERLGYECYAHELAEQIHAIKVQGARDELQRLRRLG